MILAAAMASTMPVPEEVLGAVELVLNTEFDEANAILERAVQAEPDSPGVAFYAVSACWWSEMAVNPDGDGSACSDQLEAAIELSRRRLEEDPEDAWTHYFLGRLCGLRVRIKTLDQGVRSAIGDLRRMQKSLLRAEELDPSIASDSVEVGLYDYALAQLPAVARVVTFFLRLPGGDRERGLKRLREVAEGGGPNAEEANVYLATIEVQHERTPGKGLERVLGLSRRHPKNVFFATQAALILRAKLGQPEEALAIVEQAGRIAKAGTPAARWTEVVLAQTLMDLREVDRARQHFLARVIDDDSIGESALAGLVEVNLLRDAAPEAQIAFRRLGERDSRSAGYYRKRALNRLTHPPGEREMKLTRSLEAARRAHAAGEYDAARVAYAEALVAIRGDARARSGLAEIAFQEGRLDEAYRTFEHLSRAPGVRSDLIGHALLRAGLIAEKRGNRAEAMIRFTKILGRDGLPAVKAEARDRLLEPSPGARATEALGVGKPDLRVQVAREPGADR